MIKVREAIIVEGKYDKIRLSNFIDGLIITTDGFGVFRDREKQSLLRRLAGERGLLILTDSDSAGFVIRNFLRGCVPKSQLFHAYIPEIFGKEKRKTAYSKEGLLGVEGIDEEIIKTAIAASGAHLEETQSAHRTAGEITKLDFYSRKLTGGADSSARREFLISRLKLPKRLTTNALLDVLNCLMTKDEFDSLCDELFGKEDDNA